MIGTDERIQRALRDGDQERAAAEARRAGVRPLERRYMRDLVEPIEKVLATLGSRGYVERKHYAAGIRAIAKAAGIKGMSVRTPNYSMASCVDVEGTLPRAQALELLSILGEERALRDEDAELVRLDLSLAPTHRESQSDWTSDYHHQGGVSLREDYWPVFVAAVQKAVDRGLARGAA